MAKKKVTEGKDPAVVYAEQIVQKLQTNALDFDENFRELVRIKAWTTLGYESFTKLWVEKFSDSIVGRHLAPMVGTIVDEMLKDGTPVDVIADAIHGVGPETVEAVKQKLENGVPPALINKAKTPPKESYSVSIYAGKELLPQWQAVADQLGSTVKKLATEELTEYFDKLYYGLGLDKKKADDAGEVK